MSGTGDPRRVLLLSADLMVSSRLAAQPGVAVTTDPDAAPFDAVLVDLGGSTPAAERVRVARAIADRAGRGGAAPVIAFGPHVARDRLTEAAAAGADRVASRGEALGALPALLAATLADHDARRRPTPSSH